MIGEIAFYHERKEYGFVESKEFNSDVFFAMKDLDIGDEVIEEGKTVRFYARDSNKGPKVISMNIIPNCLSCTNQKIYHDRYEKWFCPWCDDI